VALAAVLVLGVAGVALGQDAVQPAPRTLVGGAMLSGSLVGNSAGSFDYFVINYPGGSQVVTIEVRFAPGDPAVLAGVGFNVYGPAGFDVGESLPTGDNDGVERLVHSEEDATTWLIQVYNYIPDVTVSYTIGTTGLPETATPAPTTPMPDATPAPTGTPGATETPAATPGMTPEATETAMPGLTGSVSASLIGSGGGAFDRYPLEYAGDNVEVTVRLNFAPDDAVISPGVGFTIYGPSGQEVVGQPTGDPGVREATFALEEAGAYIVQVHNYIEGLEIGYTLTRE